MDNPIVIIAAVAVLAGIIYVVRTRKKVPVTLPAPSPTKHLRLLNEQLPQMLRVRESLALEWEVYELPSGKTLQDEIVNWWVERDPASPPGGPDIPCVHVQPWGVILAIAPGVRVVYGEIFGAPESKIAIVITVVP